MENPRGGPAAQQADAQQGVPLPIPRPGWGRGGVRLPSGCPGGSAVAASPSPAPPPPPEAWGACPGLWERAGSSATLAQTSAAKPAQEAESYRLVARQALPQDRAVCGAGRAGDLAHSPYPSARGTGVPACCSLNSGARSLAARENNFWTTFIFLSYQ